MSELIHDGHEALAIGVGVQQASGCEELHGQPAQSWLNRFRPGGGGQVRPAGVAILERPPGGACLPGNPGEGEVAPAFLGGDAHGSSTECAIGAPDARRLQQVGHPPTILRKAPYRPSPRGRAAIA